MQEVQIIPYLSVINFISIGRFLSSDKGTFNLAQLKV